MAKQRHESTPSNNNALIVLVVGVLVVGGLLVWALTRTVEVTPTPAQEAPLADVSTTPLTTETAARNTPPMAPLPTSTTSPATATSLTPATRPTEHTNTEDKKAVPRIAVEDLKSKWNSGDVTIIDVRPADAFAAAHIPRALHMQFANIEGQLDLIPRNKPIVLYCT